MKKEILKISVGWFGGHYVANYDTTYVDDSGYVHRQMHSVNIPSYIHTKAHVTRFLCECNAGKSVKVVF